MSLFNIPKRDEKDIYKILEKAREEVKPKIKIKGNSLLSKLNIISKNVEKNLGKEKDNYLCITKNEEFLAYIDKAVEDGVIAIDTETDSLDSMKANLVGVCLYSPSQKPAYIPIGHISAVTEKKVEKQVSLDTIRQGIQKIKNIKNIFHNAYYDLVILHQNLGIDLTVYWDTLIASHVLNENESHNLKDLYVKYILDGNDNAYHFNELFEGIPFNYIPYNICYLYGAKDAVMTYELFKFQEEYLTVGKDGCKEYKLEGASRLYKEDLLPMIPILVDMKLTGMEFDFKKAEELKIKYTQLRQEALKKFNESLAPFKNKIKEYAKKPLPYPLNYNSPEQIRILFYDIANIGVVYHKEPTGTGKNVINSILSMEKFKNSSIRQVAEYLLEVKTYDKALTSFIDKLTEDAIEHNGKIHSNLNLASTDTGRLSCIAKGTLVEVAGGQIPIEKLHEGMYVYCYDDSGNLHLRKIKRVIDNGMQKCIKVNWKSTGIHKYGELICTPDHLLRTRDGQWKRADSFTKFEQVAHLRRTIKAGRYFFYGLNSLNCNEQLIIKKDYFLDDSSNNVIHHVDENKLNNCLDNFMIMSKKEHTGFHGKLMAERGKLDVESFHKVRAAPKYGKENPRYICKIKEELLQMLIDANYQVSKVKMDFDTFKKHCAEEGIDLATICATHHKHYIADDIFIKTFYECEGVQYRIAKKLHIGYGKIKSYIDKLNLCYNHKIVSIEDYGYEQVYDLEVEEFHNFIANEICVHNCSNPNQQQVPSKLKDIRQMFKAGDGRVFINCDFSRQEPCVLASTSKDPDLIEAFNSGLDVYSKIASMMFNNKYEENLEHYSDGTINKEGKERRSAAKKVTLSQHRLLILEIV